MSNSNENSIGNDSVGELDKIRDRAEDKDVALLAQEMSFFLRSFEDYKKDNNKRLDEINSNTKGNYTPMNVGIDHEKRIARLEKAALWVLGTTFALVFIAVVGLVITKGGR